MGVIQSEQQAPMHCRRAALQAVSDRNDGGLREMVGQHQTSRMCYACPGRDN